MWRWFKRLTWQWHVVLGTAPAMAGLLIVLRMAGILQPLEWAMLDQFFCWRPQEPRDERILIVGISEADLQRYGFPLPDWVLARLVKTFKHHQSRAIGIDVYRNLLSDLQTVKTPLGANIDKLTEVFESTPNVIGITKVIKGLDSDPVAPHPVLESLGQIGASDAVLDADGRLRRGLLFLDNAQGDYFYSLSMYMAFLYLHAEGISPSSTEEGFIRLGKGLLKPFEPNDGAYIRTDNQGFQILMNFRGPRGHFRTVSVQEVLEDPEVAALGRDRIVLIGTTATSINDYFQTSFSSKLEKHLPQLMSGVEIKANLASQLLTTALEGRSTIRVWSEPMEWFWILAWSTIGATISWQQRSSIKSVQDRRFKNGLIILLASSVLVVISYGAFLHNWWIPVVPPLFALLGSAVIVTTHIAYMAGEIRKTFGRYLTDEVVTSLLETPTGLQLGGEKRKITILMSDLRGFSSLSERLPAERVVKLLNLYLEAMTEVITQYGGLINQVIGDGMVIFFGALQQQPDDTERAIACAIAMQLAMETVNRRNQLLGLPPLEMGIGINTGEVIVGNIGSLKHAQFTAIGSHVNLASRIESSSVGGQVLVSQSVVDDVPTLKIRRQIQAQLKGMKSPTTLYDVEGVDGIYNLFLPNPEPDLVPLAQEIPIQYTLLEGKKVIGTPIAASLIKLSMRGAEIRSERAIAPLSNIRITLTPPAQDTPPPDAIDAKVTDTFIGAASSFRIHFTSIPPRLMNTLLALTNGYYSGN